MPELDATDAEILHLLLNDARRSYRDIADTVDLSPPAVTNRIERLEDLGIISRYTVEVDWSQLTSANERLLTLEVRPGDCEAVVATLESTAGVHHVFQTLESRVVANAVLQPRELHSLVTETLEDDVIRNYHVDSVVESRWHPQFHSGEFDIECPVCEAAVGGNGETVELDTGELVHVCCSMCAGELVDQYESLAEAAQD